MIATIAFIEVHRLSCMAAFVSRPLQIDRRSSYQESFFEDWDSISPGRGVWKKITSKGFGDVPSRDSTLEISYTGVLVGEAWWTAQDVTDCWISELQGMDEYCSNVIANNLDGSQILDSELFTESFIEETLRIPSKVQRKKLEMAAKRLRKVRDDFEIGFEFDSRDKFSFCPKKRIIRGIRLGVESMKIGEEATLICRSDYGYGAEGLRRNNGEIIVPPFATLCFDISLLNASDA